MTDRPLGRLVPFVLLLLAAVPARAMFVTFESGQVRPLAPRRTAASSSPSIRRVTVSRSSRSTARAASRTPDRSRSASSPSPYIGAPDAGRRGSASTGDRRIRALIRPRRPSPDHASGAPIYAQISWDAASNVGARELATNKNGSTIVARTVSAPSPSPNTTEQSITTVVSLVAGDFVEVKLRQNSGGSLTVFAAPEVTPSSRWSG
jgi:hypothetical protein